MADRYWVGGTADWDATAGTKWATTSGGAGGASVPTSADDVFFTNLSTGTCTVTATANCKSLNFTGFTGGFAGSVFNINVYGSVTLAAAMSFTFTAIFILRGNGTFISAGKTVGSIRVGVFGSFENPVVTLGDALTLSGGGGGGSLTLTEGTFNTANYNISATTVSAPGGVITVNLGSSTITITNATGTALSFDSSDLALNAGTSTIIFTGSSVTCIGGFLINTVRQGVSFYNVSFTSVSAGTHNIRGINTFNNLAITAPSSAGVRQVTFDARQTINGTISTTGTAGNRRVWFQGVTYGIAQTLTINATPSLTDADFRDIYVVGTAAPISGTRIGNLRGCRGITFDTPKTVYWNFPGGNNWSGDAWAATSGGGVSTNNFPLAQDTAVIENTGLNTSAMIALNSAVPYTGTVDMSGRTNAMTLLISSNFTIYGDFKNGSGTTLSTANTLTFSGRNTQTITSAGKTFSGPITIDSYGGSVELADALNIGSNALTVTNGTFNTKNFNVTASSLSSNNSNVRTITLGSSTVTLSASSPVTFTTATNLTFNAGTSQINITATSFPNFAGNGLTFYNVTFTATTATSHAITGANTFNNLTITPPSTTGLMQLLVLVNQTITGTLNIAGASPIRRIFLRGDPYQTTITLTVGTLSATDCDFRDITIAGTAAGSSPTRAGDCGGNSGITFPAPKTVYWNLGGFRNWVDTAWAPSSGGTPNINNFPLAQDTAVFDNTNATLSVAFTGTRWNIGTLDASARTSAMTLSVDNTGGPNIYGSWKSGTGVTISGATFPSMAFLAVGTQTITSNGVQFPLFLDFSSRNNSAVELADALSVTADKGISFNAGVFDAKTYNVTAGSVSAGGSAVRTLKMGSGTWTLSGTGTVWGISTSNLVLYKNTANIVLSDTSTSDRTFQGASLSYNKLTIGGTTGTNILTISGNNQFTELASTKTVAHTIALGSTTQTFGKWTVTGTAGNVVTLTGTGTSHILAGSCTSGIDYLAMGSIGFAATSPGEFYAGVNSTGTAGAPVYRTAKPADSTRYWVGGTGNWSDTNRWSTSSGGAGGASVPRSHDDVVFNSASNATAYTATVDAVTGGIRMKSLTIAGPASGNVTLAGSTAMVGIHGNVTLPATGLTRTYTGEMVLSSNSTGLTFTTNGVGLASAITVNGVDCSWSLGSALTNSSTNDFTVTNGTFNFASYTSSPGGGIVSTTQNARSINFGSSTLTLNWVTPINFGTSESQRANLTVTAGTSQITCTQNSTTLSGNNQTFYNVSFTGHFPGFNKTINGANTFNNLSFTGSFISSGVVSLDLTANQTITGTLTFAAGTDATMRYFCRSSTFGTTRTLTVAAFSGTDVDFRDITVTGAAAPISGTRLGDAKGNSGITFVAGKTVYVRSTGSANWSSSTGWSATSGGTANVTQFPLAQDTVIFPAATYPASGSTITIDQSYNIGTIDMSLRTSNTVTLATGSTNPVIYGNWINGTGTTITGTSTITFAGRGSQTVTSAGKSFSQQIRVENSGGTVTLQDALSSTSSPNVISGTFDAASYNVSVPAFTSSNSNVRTVAIGSGTWSITSGTGSVWDTGTSTNLTVTGTGTISLTSASAKTFAGGGVAYTNITLNQGGAGALTISGNNTFKDITNTYKTTGATNITLGTTTQRVSQFTAAGEAGRLLTIQGTSASSPGTLVLTGATKPNVDYLTITGVRAYSLDTTWYAGTNSTNNGSLGWYFETGVSVYDSSLADTATGSDSVAAVLIFGSAISESSTGQDSIAARAVFASSISETSIALDVFAVAASTFSAPFSDTATALDTTIGNVSFVSALSETSTALDTVSVAASIFNAPFVDSAIGQDTVAGSVSFASDIAETSTAIDTFSSTSIFLSSIAETSTSQDAAAGTVVFLSAVSETSTGQDSISGSSLISSSVSEFSTGQDVLAALAVFQSAVSETSTGLDTTASSVVFSSSISETSTGLDAVSSLAVFQSSIAETSTALDSIATGVVFRSSVAELSTGQDTVSAAASFRSSVAESSTSQDTIAATAVFRSSVSETATGQEVTTGGSLFLVSVFESSTGQDTVTSVTVVRGSVSETSTVLDQTAATALFISSIAETSTGQDTTAVAASIFNAPFVDSVVGQDSVATSASFNSAFDESALAQDSSSGALIVNTAVSEASTGQDTTSVLVSFRSVVSETLIALDVTEVAASIFNAPIVDSATAVDTIPTNATLNISLSESATALDSILSGLFVTVAIAESANSSDATSVTLTVRPAISEAAAISDLTSAQASLTALTSESATQTDTTSASAVFAVSLSEASTVSDAINALRVLSVVISETAIGSDTTSSITVLLSSVDESAVALDSVSVAASIFNAPISESASGSDSVVSAALFATSISESATGSDSDVGFITFPASINETSTASEAVAAQAAFNATVSESSLALDAVAVAASVFNVVVPESAVAQDTNSALAILPASFADTVTVLDLVVGAYLWNLIDDDQSVNWQNINITGSPGWTPIDTSTGSSWVNIDTI